MNIDEQKLIFMRSAKEFAYEIYQNYLIDGRGENLKDRCIEQSLLDVDELIANIDKIKIILPNLWIKEWAFYMCVKNELYKLKNDEKQN